LGDALGFFQADVAPGLAAIGGFVDPVSDRNTVARPRLACSYPNILCVLGINRDGADRLHRLFIKDRPITRPTVVRFPNATTGRADKKRDFAGRLFRSGQRGNAPAHGGGTDIARAEP
jgi:hypothetical protein